MGEFIEKNIGLVAIVAMCLGAGAWFNFNHLKSEPLTPTTINTPKVMPEVEGKLFAPSSPGPLEVDEFLPKQTEEEIMASIVRNACLRRCPSGSVPVYIGDEVTGF